MYVACNSMGYFYPQVAHLTTVLPKVYRIHVANKQQSIIHTHNLCVCVFVCLCVYVFCMGQKYFHCEKWEFAL